MLSLEEIMELQAIDTHIHRIHPDRAPLWGNLSGGYIPGPEQEAFSRETLFYGMLMEALRKKFYMPENISVKEVEKERFRRYEADPAAYFRELTKGQNVAVYCLEIGSPLGGERYTEEEISYFHRSIPQDKCRHIVRIERVAEDLWKEKPPFSEFVCRFREALEKEIEKEQAVALKSCAAYGGGLSLTLPQKEEGEKAYERICRGEASDLERMMVDHFLILESCEIAEAWNLPIQFHTGEGGGGRIDFNTLSPIHMVPFLKDPRVFNRIKIVLLHGGHPFEEETSFLVSQFQQVYTDFSAMFYLSGIKGVERMAALLERAPISKVMYGSDGVMFPEMWWFTHDLFRRNLTKLLNILIEDGYMTEVRAREAAGMILYDNALSCYTELKSSMR